MQEQKLMIVEFHQVIKITNFQNFDAFDLVIRINLVSLTSRSDLYPNS